MKRSVLLVLMAISAVSTASAQVTLGPATLNSSGGYHRHELNEYEWSIGEMALVNTFSGSSIVVTQGVLQPLDRFQNSVPGTPSLSDHLKIYPNPASTVVNLQYSSETNGVLGYKLMDIAGKTIMEKNVDFRQGTTSDQINVTELAAATYMLEVIVNPANASQEKTTYKIEKLK